MSKMVRQDTLYAVRGHLSERYALALQHATGLHCPLTEFSIDRMGWSPQLAARLGEEYLGSDGMRYAIILSPDQGTAPMLRRRYSYEGLLVEKVYVEARATLLDLIEYEPLVVELDNQLTFCRTATDVLSIKAAQAYIETPKRTLGNIGKLKQLAQGLGEGARLLDDRYIDEMLALVKQVGDARKRPLPPDLRVQVGSLWADVDGAVYVLRPPAGTPGDPLVIATRPDAALGRLPVRVWELDAPQLVDGLHSAGFLRFDDERALLPKRLGELELEALLAANEQDIPSDAVDRRRRLNRSAAARAALVPLYWELSDEQKRLDAGVAFDPQQLSPEARWALSSPASETEIVVHLLSRFVRADYRLLVHHQRRRVQGEWPRYSQAKRDYLARMFPALTESFVQAAAPAPGAAPAAPAVG